MPVCLLAAASQQPAEVSQACETCQVAGRQPNHGAGCFCCCLQVSALLLEAHKLVQPPKQQQTEANKLRFTSL
jgi:hypothetical protein